MDKGQGSGGSGSSGGSESSVFDTRNWGKGSRPSGAGGSGGSNAVGGGGAGAGGGGLGSFAGDYTDHQPSESGNNLGNGMWGAGQNEDDQNWGRDDRNNRRGGSSSASDGVGVGLGGGGSVGNGGVGKGSNSGSEKKTEGADAQKGMKNGPAKALANMGAANLLRGQEKKGENPAKHDGPKDAEKGGLYTEGEQKGSEKGGKGKGKGKGKGRFKNRGALITILMFILLVILLMVGGQSTLGFSFVALATQRNNSMQYASQGQDNNTLSHRLRGTPLTTKAQENILGGGEDHMDLSKKQANKINKMGGHYTKDANGNRIILFRGENNKLSVVVPDGVDVNSIDLSKLDTKEIGKSFKLESAELGSAKIDNFSSAMKSSTEFNNLYTTASRNWRTAVGQWFDPVTSKFLKINNILRNRFRDFRERVMESLGLGKNKTEVEGEVMKEKMKEKAETGASGDINAKRVEEPEVDENGNRTSEHYTAVEDKQHISVGAGGGSESVKAEMEKAGKAGAKGSSLFAAVVNFGCSVYDAVSNMTNVIVASERTQLLVVASSFLESIDKTKAGDGDDSPQNAQLDAMTRGAPTYKMDADGNKEVIPGKDNTSGMQSEATTKMYNGGVVDPDDGSVQNFILGKDVMNNLLTSTLGALGLVGTMSTFANCTYMRMGAAMAGMGADLTAQIAIDVGGCLATMGWGCALPAVKKFVGDAAAGAAIQTAIGMAIQIVMPLAITTFTRDLISNLAGEDMGNAVGFGMLLYMAYNHLRGGGVLATPAAMIGFEQEKQKIIAENADYERRTRSPFDVTSPYTFMGNLVTQLATVYTARNSLMDGIRTVGKVTVNSVASILPIASAYDMAEDLAQLGDYEQYCPDLASIGVVGDTNCTPYGYSDSSTWNISLTDLVNKVVELGGIDNDTGHLIAGSNFDHFIRECNNRESPFGKYDNNIAANHGLSVNTGDVVVDSVGNGAISAIPIVGDVVDMLDNGLQVENMDWISGKNCVAGADTDTNFWENEGKYYHRMLEVVRKLASEDEEYNSPLSSDIVAMEDELDYSPEGIIARFTGMTKEDATDTLAMIDYMNYIATYDAGSRVAFGEDKVKVEEPLMFDNENELAGKGVEGVLARAITYFDVRNQYAAMA